MRTVWRIIPDEGYGFSSPPTGTDGFKDFGDRQAKLEAIPDFSPCPGSKRCRE